MEIRKISVLIIATMMLAAFTPLVFAATEDEVVITFDPNGDIDIDISLAYYNYTAGVNADTWTNTSGEPFTIYNNGSVAMDTQVKTNDTTDSGGSWSSDMMLNESDVAPVLDQFAFYIEDVDFPNYINNSYTDEIDQGITASGGTETFDLCLLIGTSLSANHSWQMITIYFQGSQS